MVSPDVLLVGLSVTADHQSFANQMIAEKGEKWAKCNLSIFGFAGMQLYDISFMLEGLVSKRKPEYLVMEIFTAERQAWVTEDDYCLFLLHILSVCTKLSIKLSFMLLFRRDVDYSNDVQTLVLKNFCQRFNVPLLDSVPSVVELATTMGYDQCFKDVVHPTEMTTAVYLSDFSEFLAGLFENKHPMFGDNLSWAGKMGALELHLYVESQEKRIQYRRTGLDLTCIELQADRFLAVSFDSQRHVHGLSYIRGPRSGRIDIADDQHEAISITGYDSYCYYERMASDMFSPIRTSELTIHQSPQQPDIKLRKGEVNQGDRLGKVYAVYWSSDPMPDLRAAARAAMASVSG